MSIFIVIFIQFTIDKQILIRYYAYHIQLFYQPNMIFKPQVSTDTTDYSWIQKQAKCWVYYPQQDEREIYRKGTIKGIVFLSHNKGNSKVMVLLENGETVDTKVQFIEKCRNSSSLQNDLIELETINAGEVIDQLKRKLQKRIIHTHMWLSLIIVNPFQLIAEQYNDQKLNFYMDRIFVKKENHRKFQPHIFGYICSLLVAMRNSEKAQVISISGQSGSGKTQTNKQCLRTISYCCRYGQNKVQENGIEIKILQCDPILQSFGNAKTIKNDNSSRFGKLITLKVDYKNFNILRSETRNFFLQKSRLISQAQSERNFHIFYQFLKFASVNLKTKFKLMKGKNRPYEISDFNYLNKNISKNQDSVDDKKMWEELEGAFATLGFDISKDQIYSIISGILLLGNIEYDGSTQSQQDPCTITTTQIVENIANLFQIPLKQLNEGLLLHDRVIAGQAMKIPLTQKQCIQGRDSIAKALYQGLFFWLVSQLNKKVNSQSSFNGSQNYREIKLLDIYGFQVFQRNSFEQLCVNYTNEKIHQIYLDQIFKHQKNTLQKEGLGSVISTLNFTDNNKIIQLLETNSRSIYNLLDQSCAVNVKDDDFLSNVRKNHDGHQHFPTANYNNIRKSFIIFHTPGNIQYYADGFRDKNKDLLREDIMLKFSQSNNRIINHVFKGKLQSLKSESNRKFLGTKIRKQVAQLVQEMSQNSELHFVRCIKPNETKSPFTFVDRVCYNQIKYLGILDTIQMRKDSYHVRIPYSEFYKKYGVIDQRNIKKLIALSENKVSDQQCKDLTMEFLRQNFTNLNLEYLFGKNRIFMKMSTQNVLDTKLAQCTRIKDYAATLIKYYNLRLKREWKRKIFKENVVKVQRSIKKFFKVIDQVKRKIAVKRIWRWWQQNREKYFLKKKRKYLLVLQIHIKKIIKEKQAKIKKKFTQFIKKTVLSAIKTNKIYQNYQHYMQIRQEFLQPIFTSIWTKMAQNYKSKISKYINTYLTRINNKDVVFRAQNKARYRVTQGLNIKIGQYLKTINFVAKMSKKRKSAIKIQSFWRMKSFRTSFLHLRSNVIKIQRKWRRYKEDKNFNIEYTFNYFQKSRELHQQNLVWREQLFRSYGNYDIKDKQCIQSTLKAHQKIKKDKIVLFYYLLDFQILTDISKIYPQCSWISNYTQLFKSSFEKNNPIQFVDISDQQTLCATTNKVYSWGNPLPNQNRQKISQISFINGRIKEIRSDNSGGTIQTIDPDEIISLQEGSKAEQQSKKEWRTLEDTYVNFNGVVLTILGLSLTKINFTEKVTHLSCGMAHMICRTSLKKVFTWGSNEMGQLGQGHFHRVKEPRQIDYFNKQKILAQGIGASAYGSIVLDHNCKLWWFGSNGTISLKCIPQQCLISMKSQFIDNPQKYTVVRVLPKWSKTMSLIGITVACHDEVFKTQITLRKKTMQSLISKWLQDSQTVNPPYIPNIAGYFSQRSMPLGRSHNELNKREKSPFLQRQVREKMMDEIKFMNEMQKQLLSTRQKNNKRTLR